MSFLYWGAQTQTQHSKCCKRERTTSLGLLATFLLMQLRMSLIFSSCKGTLLAHVQTGVNQHLQVHFSNADLQMGDHQCILVCGTFPPQVKDFSLPFVEPYGVPVKVHLGASTTSGISTTPPSFVSSGNWLEGAFCPITQTTNDNFEDNWTLC